MGQQTSQKGKVQIFPLKKNRKKSAYHGIVSELQAKIFFTQLKVRK